MGESSRRVAAACLLCTVAGAGTCQLAAPRFSDGAAALGVTSLGLELLLASAALAGALLSRRTLRERLGLGPNDAIPADQDSQLIDRWRYYFGFTI